MHPDTILRRIYGGEKSDRDLGFLNMSENEFKKEIWSVCPVCLKRIPAALERSLGREGIWLRKTCPEHGFFEVPVWKDRFDFDEWTEGETALSREDEAHCIGNCRSCSFHLQDCCCVILEVTKACNLHCPYCFAFGGESSRMPGADELKASIDIITEKGGSPLLQLSGGEPTLRDDLPELVRYGKEKGCSYLQVNTNGIRIAEDEAFTEALADAGLDIVFLQFDGTDDDVYRILRGRELLDIKKKAIENCSRHGLSVTLVPTVVRGINDDKLGSIVDFAISCFPAVRAVHFQPVTYLGRYPHDGQDRITLDELMDTLCMQTGIDPVSLLPSRCDHALCEFHGTYIVNREGKLIPTSNRKYFAKKKRSSAFENREFVAGHWTGSSEDPCGEVSESMDFDSFIYNMTHRSMTISAMAFQDAMDLNLERLARCSLLVYEEGKLLPFCGKYLTPAEDKAGNEK